MKDESADASRNTKQETTHETEASPSESQDLSRRDFLKTVGVGAAAVGASSLFPFVHVSGARAADGGPVKIAVIEDQSGNFALFGAPKVHAAELAVKEINENGGILGRKVELLTPDPQSDNTRFQQLVRRMILQENVDVIHAGFASAEREAIRPIMDKHEQLYFYNNQYEGGVADKYTFCTGAVPEQQILPVMEYMVNNYGPRVYIPAADYNFGQLSAMWTEAAAPIYGAEVVGKEFIPLSVSEFSDVLSRIQDANPDWNMMYITGQNHASYYPQSNQAGIHYPMGSSINMAQGYEHLRYDPPALKDMHVAVNYMQEIPTERNRAFVKRWHEMFPDEPYISQQAQNSYVGVKLYAKAAERAGSTDQAEVIKALESGIGLDAPEGPVWMDPATHHLTHPIRMAKADANHNISFVKKWDYIEPWWLRRVGVNLVKTPEYHQYTPQEDPYFEWFREKAG